ncbi:uncharacterized protein LOC119598605 [Penaeus monodon]|uniref:uncharacterized protein LOC119598605 n=1 Tax=Penaeus monodon TaxID=6687 RepID=UPI0018A73CBC|nr:uncharacterized protein LOC119598605 [Penaeus monodon]
MTSFCRITGHARNLPKPCYFPLLPPISPADAKKLCRITGKASTIHSFSPLVSFGKPMRFDGAEGCRITKFEDFQYMSLIFEKTKDNEKTFDDLDDVLRKVKSKRKKQVEKDREFVYHSSEMKSSIIFPPEMEEAIRTGELESVSMSKDHKFVNIKIKQGRVVKINLKKLQLSAVKERQDLYFGRGQNQDVLEQQQELLNERNKRKANTMARKKRFEALDAKAEAEELRDTVKPAYNKPKVKFNAKQRAEKLAKMEAMMREQATNKSIVLPKVDTTHARDEELQYERMLHDISLACRTSVNLTICSSGYDWLEAQEANQAFNWLDFPQEELIDPVEVETTNFKADEAAVREDISNLDIVVSIETIQPTKPTSQNITEAVFKLKDEKVLKLTEDVNDVLKIVKDDADIPSFAEISQVASVMEKAEVGYMVENAKGAQFITKEEYFESEAKAVSGAMVELKDKKKFVTGQVIKLGDQESFVAGQTIETPAGKKFVPGQTILDKKGEIKFVPGQCMQKSDESIEFVAGQIFNTENGPQFIPGQMMDKGEGKEVFVSGQTIHTEEGPKFSPGEVTVNVYGEDVFVPGLAMPTDEGERFVAGQVFQTEEGVSFKPGQILDTVEGPSFVPGKTFNTPEGKKFIKGDMVQGEDGQLKFEHTPFEVPKISEWLVIPNKELQPVAVADTSVAGFIVNPTNMTAIQIGEKLYGDMVETQDTVQFYVLGKLPESISPESKVIPGQLIASEKDQRFVPGKLMSTADGEKFVPGQVVNTTHGEEFIPGQIVESTEGPKFIPGQLVMTSQGEKFVPGQVIIEEEGPKFVPGQIIQTKNGATFIPGQMMNTDEGQLFVPGQLVETNDGPRFVPGQVVESPEGPRFIPGTIIETDEGLKYVPPDADEYDEDFEFSFQGFEVSAEELKLLMTNPVHARPHSPILNDECLIDTATLKKLADTVVVHGVTPEPPPPEKKKKKRARVQIDADDGEKMEIDETDEGTDKLEVLQMLLKASSCISETIKAKEMKKLSKQLGEKEHESFSSVQVDAMARILGTVNGTGDSFRAFFGDDELLISTILENIGDIDNLIRNDQAKKTLQTSIQTIVTNRCDQEIDDIIHLLNINPDYLLTDTRTQILLTEAVGIVCVTGNVEVASMLEKFISEPSDPNELRNNKDVVSVLRQLIVLHQMSDRDPEVSRILQVLQTNPEGVKDRRKVRQLLKSTKLLLKSSKDESRVTKFDIRHVASSKDIPTEIFEQIKEDRKEADKFLKMLPDELFQAIMKDKRCGDRLLESLDSEKAGRAKADLEKFKSGMAIVVTKEKMQAVIPREFARSVCYGIMPYILIDEEGFKFFERGLTGRKLAPARVIENTWYMPDSYYLKKPSFERTMSGEQYCMVLLGQRRPSAPQGLLYTSLLPSSGPTKLSYNMDANNDDSLSRYCSRATNIIWSDLDGAPLTTHRRASRALPADLDEVEPAPSHKPRRASRAHTTNLTDLDSVPFTYRRATREEKKEYGESYAVMPYEPIVIEETLDTKPICRSDTVANLLDKYTNFSTKREFGYRGPTSAWARHLGETHAFVSTIPDADDSLDDSRRSHSRTGPPVPAENDLAGLPRSREHSRSRTPRAISTGREVSAISSRDEPVRSTEAARSHDNPYSSRESQISYGRDSTLSHNRSRFSDIYEEDEDEVLPPLEERIQRRTAALELKDDNDMGLNLPKGRPGGALERYRQGRAREAQGLRDFEEANGLTEEPIRTSRAKKLQDIRSQDPYSRNSQEPLYHPRQDPYGRSAHDSYSRPAPEPYNRAAYNPYDWTGQDMYNRPSQDQYGRAPHDPYSRGLHDPYGRGPPDPYACVPLGLYGRPPADSYGYQDSYGRASQDAYGRGYSRGGPDNYEDENRQYGSARRTSYGGAAETRGHGGGYGLNRPSYGKQYEDYNDDDESEDVYTTQQRPVASSLHDGNRSLTPRQEERQRISILASKYLKGSSLPDD